MTQYCGGHGEAEFTPSCGNGEGTCKCKCRAGWSGRNCELKDGEPCNINDCYHRTFIGLNKGGNYSGTRPNCKCKCGSSMFNFNGGDEHMCTRWKYAGRTGTTGTTSSNFNIQGGTE